MARGVNKVILIGNLGRDPEIRYSPSGTAVGNIRLATTEGRKDKDTGQWQDHTEWHQVVLLGRLAEVAGEYLKKGSKVYIEGRLQTRKYADKSGVERYTTEIVANDMQMLDGKGTTGGMPNSYDDYSANSGAAGQGASSSGRPAPRPHSSTEHPPEDSFDDDIPF